MCSEGTSLLMVDEFRKASATTEKRLYTEYSTLEQVRGSCSEGTSEGV